MASLTCSQLITVVMAALLSVVFADVATSTLTATYGGVGTVEHRQLLQPGTYVMTDAGDRALLAHVRVCDLGAVCGVAVRCPGARGTVELVSDAHSNAVVMVAGSRVPLRKGATKVTAAGTVKRASSEVAQVTCAGGAGRVEVHLAARGQPWHVGVELAVEHAARAHGLTGSVHRSDNSNECRVGVSTGLVSLFSSKEL